MYRWKYKHINYCFRGILMKQYTSMYTSISKNYNNYSNYNNELN